MTIPLLFAPQITTLEEARICTDFDAAIGVTSAKTARYRGVEVVTLKQDTLYVIASANVDLKVGQYLRRNEWLEEQLESEEPLYMIYDTLADMIIGSRRAKDRYRMVEIPRFRELGVYARSLVWQSYCGRAEPQTALAMEAFVLAQPATTDDALADALDSAYLLVSDHDNTGRVNRRRKTLQAEAVLNVIDERLARIDEATVEIEECIYIGLDRMRQIHDALEMAQKVIGNRLCTEPDPTRLEVYAVELEELERRLLIMVDRPFVRMTSHLRRALGSSAKFFREGKAVEARRILGLEEEVIALTLWIYPRLFNLRLAMASETETTTVLKAGECLDYLREIQAIHERAAQFGSDHRLVGEPLAKPVLGHLREAAAALTDGFICYAYTCIKQAAAGM